MQQQHDYPKYPSIYIYIYVSCPCIIDTDYTIIHTDHTVYIYTHVLSIYLSAAWMMYAGR